MQLTLKLTTDGNPDYNFKQNKQRAPITTIYKD